VGVCVCTLASHFLKLAGARWISRRAPLVSISRPVSRVLSARAKRPRLTVIPLRRRLPGALSNLPGRPDPDIDPEDRSARADASLAPPLFGLAPGGVCRAACVAARAVRSYRTVSPLPPVTPLSGEGWGGGLFSVALSLGSTPAGRYPAPYAHGARTFLPDRLSAWPERPSSRLTDKGWGLLGPTSRPPAARPAAARRGIRFRRACLPGGAHRARR
jgi:hypothetical protein